MDARDEPPTTLSLSKAPRAAPPDEPPDEPDTAFDFDAGGHRLRARCRWGAAGVALGAIMPYEVVLGRPQYVWDLFDELPAAGIVAIAAPAIAALVIALVGWRAKRPGAVAWAVLAALVGMRLCVDIGRDAAAWGALGLPESITARQGWAVIALGMTAAGAVLTFRPHARRAGWALLIGAVAVAAAFFSWPGRGEAPIRTVWRAFEVMGDLPGLPWQLGMAVLATITLWPALIALAGLWHLRAPARDDHPVVALAALYGLPVLIAMLVLRGVPIGAHGWTIFVGLGGIIVLTATVALLASAFEVAIEATFAPPPGVDRGPGLAPRRAALVALIALAAVVAGQAVLARPPLKGVEWTLGPRTAEADALFTDTLPAWNTARVRWERSTRHGGGGASAVLAIKQAAREAIRAAEAIDPGLGAAVEQLTREARDLHVAGRTWYRLVAAVNDASRAAALPYYLDPTVYTFTTPDGPRRLFQMKTFAIERVRRFEAAGRRYATLHVRRIDDREAGSRLLGFSRDAQRFALVDLAEATEFETSLAAAALEDPPVCAAIVDDDATRALRRCGEVLARLLRAADGGLSPAIVAVTDRHELQHQIDGPHLAMASAVLERLPARGDAYKERVNRELSAYVAEMTAPEVSPLVGLIHLVRFAAQGRGHLHDVAMLAFEAMVDRPLDDAFGRDHRAIADAFAELAGLPPEGLRARAARAWQRLYGDELVEAVALD